MPHFCEQNNNIFPHPHEATPLVRPRLPPTPPPCFCTGQCLDHCHPVFSVSCMRMFASDCVAASPIHLCLSLPVPFIFLHLPRIVECAHSAHSQWHTFPQSCSSLSGVAAFSEANGACAVSRSCVSRHGGCSVERSLSGCCILFLRSYSANSQMRLFCSFAHECSFFVTFPVGCLYSFGCLH